MKKRIIIKMELELCDKDRNFNEIVASIYETVKQRNGVDKVEPLSLEEIK